jgi:hypothetical protein
MKEKDVTLRRRFYTRKHLLKLYSHRKGTDSSNEGIVTVVARLKRTLMLHINFDFGSRSLGSSHAL